MCHQEHLLAALYKLACTAIVTRRPCKGRNNYFFYGYHKGMIEVTFCVNSYRKYTTVLCSVFIPPIKRRRLKTGRSIVSQMICGTKKKYVENVFKVKHMTFERVNSFVYWGTLITTDNNTSAEINNRITLANRSYFGLVNILKAKNTYRKHKVIIYKTLI
jgi:hypothetical protein